MFWGHADVSGHYKIAPKIHMILVMPHLTDNRHAEPETEPRCQLIYED